MGQILPKPVTKKYLTTQYDTHSDLVASSGAMQGWRRFMEDAHVIHLDLHEKEMIQVFAVFDGHSGGEVAQYCATHFPKCIHDFVVAYALHHPSQPLDFTAILQATFLYMDQQLYTPQGQLELKRIIARMSQHDEHPELDQKAEALGRFLMERAQRKRKQSIDSNGHCKGDVNATTWVLPSPPSSSQSNLGVENNKNNQCLMEKLSVSDQSPSKSMEQARKQEQLNENEVGGNTCHRLHLQLNHMAVSNELESIDQLHERGDRTRRMTKHENRRGEKAHETDRTDLTEIIKSEPVDIHSLAMFSNEETSPSIRFGWQNPSPPCCASQTRCDGFSPSNRSSNSSNTGHPSPHPGDTSGVFSELKHKDPSPSASQPFQRSSSSSNSNSSSICNNNNNNNNNNSCHGLGSPCLAHAKFQRRRSLTVDGDEELEIGRGRLQSTADDMSSAVSLPSDLSVPYLSSSNDASSLNPSLYPPSLPSLLLNPSHSLSTPTSSSPSTSSLSSPSTSSSSSSSSPSSTSSPNVCTEIHSTQATATATITSTTKAEDATPLVPSRPIVGAATSPRYTTRSSPLKKRKEKEKPKVKPTELERKTKSTSLTSTSPTKKKSTTSLTSSTLTSSTKKKKEKSTATSARCIWRDGKRVDIVSSAGTTAVVALKHETRLFVANAGDSRCVLSRAGVALDLSTDHKPENKLEEDRIYKAGGVVEKGRINGCLNLSRAIGDIDFKMNAALPPREQMITAFPDVYVHEMDVDVDEFMVLACDGIWECMSSQDVVSFIRTRLYPLKTTCTSSDQQSSSSDSSKNNSNSQGGRSGSSSCAMDLEAILSELFETCLATSKYGRSEGEGLDNMTAIVVKF